MAKTKRPRHSSEDAYGSRPRGDDRSFDDLPPPLKFVAGIFRPATAGQAWQALDVLDWIIYLGVVWVTLKTPFLFDRETTENFLTPKEFWSKQTLALLGVVFAIRFVYSGVIRLSRTRLDFPLALFFSLSVLSVAWNYNGVSAIRDLRGTFLIMMLYPFIVNTVKTRWQLEGILWAIVLGGVATAGLGIMESENWYYRWDAVQGWVWARDEIFNGQIDYKAYYLPLFPQLADKNYNMTSIVSTFGNRNYLGTFTMFTAFIPLSFYFYYRNVGMKALSMALYGVMLYGLYITRCRAALLGIICGIAFMTLMLVLLDRQWRFVKRNAAFFVCVLGILVIGFGVAVTSSKSFNMLDKIKSTFTMDRKTSNTYERLWVWYATFQSFAKNPFKWLVGSGFGSFKHFFPLQEATTFDDENKETFTAVTFRQAHNDWLQLVSELGLLGLGIFLFLLWRFFAIIYQSVRAETMAAVPEGTGPPGPADAEAPAAMGEFKGDHVLLIGLGAAMVSQLVAAVPDFPFHRIETALYAVVVLALVPTLGETGFFKRPLPAYVAQAEPGVVIAMGVVVMVAGLLGYHFERKTYRADTLVRLSETMIQSRQAPEVVNQAKANLLEAIAIDPLPGDPYLKLSTILEMEGKGQEALEMADRAWKNINFNARSTYHSVVFRRMHIYYYILQDRMKALQEAELGKFLTCGDARSIYYFYIGKIAWELGDLEKAEKALERAITFPAFETQAGAVLAVVKAHRQKWAEAYAIGASVSRAIGGADPTILDVVGIAASNLGEYATAETNLRRALELQPGHPIFKRDLGITLVRQNRLAEARPLLEDAYDAPTTPPQIKVEIEGLLASMSVVEFGQANSLVKAGKQAEALPIVQRLLKGKAVSPQVQENLKAMLGGTLPAMAATAAPAPVLSPASASPAPPSPAGPASSPDQAPPAPAPDQAPGQDQGQAPGQDQGQAPGQNQGQDQGQAPSQDQGAPAPQPPEQATASVPPAGPAAPEPAAP